MRMVPGAVRLTQALRAISDLGGMLFLSSVHYRSLEVGSRDDSFLLFPLPLLD
jgi:hypothetical protein